MHSQLIWISKFLSRVLRHEPGFIGLALDAGGWADVAELITKARAAVVSLTEDLLHEVVLTNDKQRYSLSEDNRRIRANQGHSIRVELGLTPRPPPKYLSHGTAERNLASIRAHGLRSGRRNHVYLSTDEATAVKVDRRHGLPVVLRVHTARMHADGWLFYLSANGVWLTENIPAEYNEILNNLAMP